MSSGNYTIGFYATDPDTLVDSMPFQTSDLDHNVRVLYHDNFATVYIDEYWVVTFGFSSLKNDEDPIYDVEGITYSDTLHLYLSTNHSSLTFSNVRVCELADWREAVYVDLETDGRSAIQSVIQERPIEIGYKSNGAISYSYNSERSTITPSQDIIRSHAYKGSYPETAGSDGIVYFSDVRIIQDLDLIGNNITSVEWIEGLTRLENLDILFLF